MKKFISTVLLLGFLWLTISFIDIIADNTSPNPSHMRFNAFVLLTDK